MAKRIRISGRAARAAGRPELAGRVLRRRLARQPAEQLELPL